MCKYCEPNEKGLFAPLASTKVGGFTVPLVNFGINENTGRQVMFVHYDEEEPLMMDFKFCPMCGRNLKE